MVTVWVVVVVISWQQRGDDGGDAGGEVGGDDYSCGIAVMFLEMWRSY